MVIALWMASPALAQQPYPITQTQPPVTTVQPAAAAPAPIVARAAAPHAKVAGARVAGVVAGQEPAAAPAEGGLAFTGMAAAPFVAAAAWLFALGANLVVAGRRRGLSTA
jgi:hypothetical protein